MSRHWNLNCVLVVIEICICGCGDNSENTNEHNTITEPLQKKLQESNSKEALETLVAFKDTFSMIRKSADLAQERDDCAFGDHRYLEDSTDQDPKYQKCMERCLSKAEILNCYGKCWKKAGGKQSFEERRTCHAAYIDKIKAMALEAVGKSEKLSGCPRDMYSSFANAVATASAAEIKDGTAFPIDTLTRNETLKQMKPCIKKYFVCTYLDSRPCTPSIIGGVMNLDDGEGSKSIKVSLRDGIEINVKNLQMK